MMLILVVMLLVLIVLDVEINDNHISISISIVVEKTMKKKFYLEEKAYKIYALYDDIAERRAYIGKTVNVRMSSVFSWHRCGHNKYTQELFEIDFLDPNMVVLEDLTCTGAVAYRHVLSWVRYFEDNGFEMLNPGGTLAQAEQMQEETLKIYEQIADIPFEEHLHGTWQKKSTAPKRMPKKIEKEKASTQLCLRLSPTDKAEFQRYCRRTNLRQTDAFAKLLHTSGENAAPDIRRLSDLLDESETRCTQLAEENEKLRSGLVVPRSERIENNARERFNFAQKAIQAFVKITYIKDRYTDLPIREFRYDDFKHRFPNAAKYQYPSDEGTHIIYLQALVWGKSRNPVYFLMCKTPEGEYLKFRFYPKKEFIGEQVRHSFYALLDSPWLFAGRLASDGAVDLVAAFPLLNPASRLQEENLSLDAQISGTESQKKI